MTIFRYALNLLPPKKSPKSTAAKVGVRVRHFLIKALVKMGLWMKKITWDGGMPLMFK